MTIFLFRMVFKIVQTIEKGKYVLWTVPEAWECGGVLRMPKAKVNNLRRDPDSVPDDSWRKSNCILKRSGFVEFESAEAEIQAMAEASDTEQENISPNIVQSSSALKDFNDMANILNDSTALNELNDIAINEAISEFVVVPTSSNEQIQFSSAEIQTQSSNDAAQITSTRHNCTCNALTDSKLEHLQESLGILSVNQDTILKTLSALTVQFEEYVKRSTTTEDNRVKVYPKSFEPIANVKALEDLEDSLKLNENAALIKNSLSSICGQGKGRAINNAYALIDAMFQREFLEKCSWAGGSRGPEEKNCFKKYERVIDTFFHVVHISDRTFTKMECNRFLQNVLRNAKKRIHSKRLRASGGKRRLKIKVSKTTDKAGSQLEKRNEKELDVPENKMDVEETVQDKDPLEEEDYLL